MSALTSLHHALSGGAVQVIDLTQTLSPQTPVISLPPPFAQSAPFSTQLIARFDSSCPTCYWNNISMGEHTGTHLDAPAHWITGHQHPDGFTDTIPAHRLIAPACVIDCTAEAGHDEQFLLQPEHISAWESLHGQLPEGSWVIMRTGWSRRGTAKTFLNLHSNGPHSPGPSVNTVRLMVERGVNGFGVETVGTDAGHAMHFDPPFPFHHIGLGANLLGIASLTNLDLLPPTGSLLIACPLKMAGGSGSPLRVLALVEQTGKEIL